MNAAERAADIKTKLLAAEAAHVDSPQLKALHASLAAGVAEQGATLGLTSTETDDLLAGEPKD